MSLIADTLGAPIRTQLQLDQRWTGDHSILVLRHTYTSGGVKYEGDWAGGSGIVGIQHVINTVKYFGWLQLEFDKTTEVVILVDYAYDSIPGQSIVAGQKSR